MTLKYCPTCKQQKLVTEFYKNKCKHDGLHQDCITCTKKKYKENALTEKWKIARKKYICKAKENIMYLSAKKRAKKYNLEFSIDKSDVVIPDICPALGIPIDRNAKPYSDNTPSFDRIDNSKGYIKGNVCVISFKANRIKSNATYDELKLLINYIERLINQPKDQ